MDFATNFVTKSLEGFDDGELYIESTTKESISFKNSKVEQISRNISEGFGLRGIESDFVSYTHSNRVDKNSLKSAGEIIKFSKSYSEDSNLIIPVSKDSLELYSTLNPINGINVEKRIDLMKHLQEYAYSLAPELVSINQKIDIEYQKVQIIKNNGFLVTDLRPLIRYKVGLVIKKHGKRQNAVDIVAARVSSDTLLNKKSLQHSVSNAIKLAKLKFEAKPFKGGKIDVVLGNGGTGILMHEVVGHSLEADVIRHKKSVYSNLFGQKIAPDFISIVDDGSMTGKVASLNFDAEGTPSKQNILIRNGVLEKSMNDRLNARLMGEDLTGNARRESFKFPPIPRMTTTYLSAGKEDPQNIIEQVSNGIYVDNLESGSVDKVNGDFSFNSTICYRIMDGKIQEPLIGGAITGSVTKILNNIIAVGSDLKFDRGGFTSKKAGQVVNINVGMPTILVDGLVVGGETN